MFRFICFFFRQFFQPFTHGATQKWISNCKLLWKVFPVVSPAFHFQLTTTNRIALSSWSTSVILIDFLFFLIYSLLLLLPWPMSRWIFFYVRRFDVVLIVHVQLCSLNKKLYFRKSQITIVSRVSWMNYTCEQLATTENKYFKSKLTGLTRVEIRWATQQNKRNTQTTLQFPCDGLGEIFLSFFLFFFFIAISSKWISILFNTRIL